MSHLASICITTCLSNFCAKSHKQWLPNSWIFISKANLKGNSIFRLLFAFLNLCIETDKKIYYMRYFWRQWWSFMDTDCSFFFFFILGSFSLKKNSIRVKAFNIIPCHSLSRSFSLCNFVLFLYRIQRSFEGVECLRYIHFWYGQ